MFILKMIFNYTKKTLKVLFEKLKIITPSNQKAAYIDHGVWDRYYNLSLLINIVLQNIELEQLKKTVFLEAGIGHGNTFLYLALIAEKLDIRLFGYDSFKGFPKIINDKDRRVGGRKIKEGQWNVNSIEGLKNKLKNCGVKKSFINNKIILIKGFFDTTLKNYDKDNKISFLHLDVDLYSSYKTCLKHLWDHVIDGGIVVFDEYHDKRWPDAKDAIDEFFSKKGIEVKVEDLTKRGYVIKTRTPNK